MRSRHRRVAHADRLAPDAGRVGERAEEVERRRHAELLAGRAERTASPGGSAARSRSRRPPRATQRATPVGPELDRRRRAPRARRPSRTATTRRGCRAWRRARPRPPRSSAAIVETLTVPARSPPVPHVSIAPSTSARRRARRSGASCARARRARASVSPFVRSATMKPAVCTSVASPSRISPSARVDVVGRQLLAPQQRPSTSGQDRVGQSAPAVHACTRIVLSPTRDRGRARRARSARAAPATCPRRS